MDRQSIGSGIAVARRNSLFLPGNSNKAFDVLEARLTLNASAVQAVHVTRASVPFTEALESFGRDARCLQRVCIESDL